MMKDELEKFINNNRDELDKETPDPIILERVLWQMNDVPLKKEKKGILISFRVLQWAAACIIVISAGIAFWVVQKQQNVKTNIAINTVPKNQADTAIQTAPAITKYKIIKRQAVDSVDESLAMRKQAFLAKLNTRKSNINKQVLFASLKNMDSPAGRITATSKINQLKNAGNDVVDVLVETLNHDPSANVRMAALDGLAKFYRDDYVRKKLVASLPKQQDPVVQIAMIELLTRMKESAILTELDQLVDDENTMKAVKDCAYSSILRLRSS